MQEYTIDAKNRSLGRVASEAAAILRGKNDPEFQPNVAPNIKLTVSNVAQMKLTGQKAKQKEYRNYSGYPGSLRFTTLEELVAKKGKAEVFRRAVFGMLPKTKLYTKMIKNLIVKE